MQLRQCLGTAQLRIASLSVPRKRSVTTTVVALQMRKQDVSPAIWQELAQLQSPQAMKQALTKLPGDVPPLIDLFNVQRQADHLTARFRIPSAELLAWLKAPLPCAVHPLGDDGSRFGVLWDSAVQTLQGVRETYQHVHGFAGIAASQRGLGARFEHGALAAARKGAGLSPGDVYVLSGVPCDMTDASLMPCHRQGGRVIAYN